MATAESVKNKIINLTNKANEVTGNNDADLTSAVNSLVDGYGGGTANLQEKTVTPSDSEQNITADDGYTGLSEVKVEKISKPYINSLAMKSCDYLFAADSFIAEKSHAIFDMSVIHMLDTSNCVSFTNMFKKQNEEYFEIPLIETGNGRYFSYMFNDTKIRTIPQIDVSNGEDFNSMFFSSYIEEIPFLNTIKGIKFTTMFAQSRSLINIGGIESGNGEDFYRIFYLCSNLVTIGGEIDFGKATNVTGAFLQCRSLKEVRFKAIRVFDNNFSVQNSPLSEESLASLVNALSDNSGLDTTYTVTLGATNIAKLTEEQLAIVAAKNINLA